jgi:hypothetical protein
MKKALVVLLVLTCLSAAAFADVAPLKISGSLETGFVVGMPKDGTNTLKLYDNDEGNATRFLVGIAFTSADGNWGLNTRLDAEGLIGDGSATGKSGALAIGVDRATLWGSVVPMVTLKGGLLDEEAFATAWEGWGNWIDGQVGFEVLVKPMDGLTIGYLLPVTGATDTFNTLTGIPQPISAFPGSDSLNSTLASSTLLAAYSMPNLANVQLGYRNGAFNTGYLWGGVDVKAIPNVLARVEFQAMAKTAAATIFEEAGYTMGAIGLDLAMWQDVSSESGSKIGYNFEPSVTYDMTVAKVGLGFDFGNDAGQFWGVILPKPALDGTSFAKRETNYDTVAWVQMPFGANLVKIGFAYGSGTKDNNAGANTSATTQTSFFVNYRVFF